MRRSVRASAVLLAAIAVIAAAATPALAKSYSAERFDSRLRVLPDGVVEVSETIVFRFESGAFDHVFREVSARRTDGLQIVEASMDGVPFPRGEGVNRIEVREGSRTRVRWRFAPRSGSTHTFVLVYRARGVVQQDAGADVLAWRALPTQHQYRIEAFRVEIELPPTVSAEAGATLPTPHVEWHRVDGPVEAGIHQGREDLPSAGLVAHAAARNVRPNGWAEVRLELPRGSLVAAAPAWQQRASAARALAPGWLTAAGLIVGAGLIVLFAVRQQYDAPLPEVSTWTDTAAPDSLPPALAGALLSNGRTSAEHATATMFALASRGVLEIQEQRRGMLGQRNFVVRLAARPPLARHESTLLSAALGEAKVGEEIPLSTIRRRLVRAMRPFSAAVREELQAAGLIDPERKRVRDRFGRIAVGLFVLAAVAFVPAVFSVDRFDGWPLLVPAAFLLVAVSALIFAASTTPLSNDAVRRAAQWRGFKKYLKSVAQDREAPAPQALGALLPFAVTAGLAAAWARFLEQHPGSVPSWFRALSSASQDGAFTAFVASSSVAHGGGPGGGGGGGGAAGGGSSGAG